MRNHFSKILYELIKENKKIILLSADIGNRLFDKIKKDFPKNFLNCGIAESNMITFASGLSKNGFIPICYTITNFLIYKTFEQIRNDSIYNKNKIIIVGTGSGFSYNHLGPTHHSLEDIGILNNLPDINIFSPSDNNDLKVHLNYAVKRKNHFCTYLRIGKKNEPLIKKPQSKINELNFLIKKKSKNAIVFTGPLSEEVSFASKLLEEKNLNFSIINLHQIKPMTKKMISGLSKFQKIYTVEEHFSSTGIKSILSNELSKKNIRIVSINKKNIFISELGSRSYIRDRFGISGKKIYKNILNDCEKNRN